MGRGLGTTQRGIIAALMKLPIESWPRGIPVVTLAEALGCSDRQIRTAAYSLHRRGLVALQKEARPGRQGLSLIVWWRPTYEGWQEFTDPTRRDAHLTAKIEEQRRLYLRNGG